MPLSPGAAALLSLALALPARAEPARIGAAGAVAGGVSAAAPGGASRPLGSGAVVYHNDDVRTDAQGRLQVLLLDQTVFTVGPKSDIVLDEFVYDPFTDAGTVSANVTKGVFRFVTGKVARKDPARMKVKVPSGTIGIRGTIGGGVVRDDGTTLVGLLGPGPSNNADERVGGITVDTDHGSVDLDKPGTGVVIDPRAGPGPVFTLSPSDLGALNAGGTDRPAPEPAGGAPATKSASEDSGQTTAVGGTSAVLAIADDRTSQSAGQTTGTAAQDATQAILDGVATWDNARSIPTGHAYYQGSGSFALSQCGGGACAAPSGSFNVTLNIDFGNRTVGGGCSVLCNGSQVNGSASDTATNTSVSFGISIPQTSFAALTGPAHLTAASGAASTAIDLLNQGGVAAAQAAVKVSYDDGSTRGAGSTTAARIPGVPQLF